jgi:hypothetical protein
MFTDSIMAIGFHRVHLLHRLDAAAVVDIIE